MDNIGMKVAEVSKEGFIREKSFKKTMKKLEGKLDNLYRMFHRNDGLLSPSDVSDERRSSNFPHIQYQKLGMMSRQSSVMSEKTSPKLAIKNPLKDPARSNSLVVAKNSPASQAAKILKQRSVHMASEHPEAGRLLSDEGEHKKKNYGRMRSMHSLEHDAYAEEVESDEARERRRTRSCPSKKSLKEDENYIESDEDDPAISPGVVYFKCFTHRKSRQSPYPSSNVNRYVVPDFAVNWEIAFPEYSPRTFTDRSLTVAGGMDTTALKDAAFQFNEVDGEVDRRSNVALYKVVNGMPRNPMGRTGIQGRGRLPFWGPNHWTCSIISRWKRNKEGDICQRNGSNVLEFFAVKSSAGYSIPMGPMKANMAISTKLLGTITQMIQTSDGTTPVLKTEIDQFFESGREIFKGYIDDSLNTDNAWKERTVVNFHDEDGQLTNCLKPGNAGPSAHFAWQEIKKGTGLDASHLEFLAIVAELKRAAF